MAFCFQIVPFSLLWIFLPHKGTSEGVRAWVGGFFCHTRPKRSGSVAPYCVTIWKPFSGCHIVAQCLVRNINAVRPPGTKRAFSARATRMLNVPGVGKGAHKPIVPNEERIQNKFKKGLFGNTMQASPAYEGRTVYLSATSICSRGRSPKGTFYKVKKANRS
jgi:hypothetical protein